MTISWNEIYRITLFFGFNINSGQVEFCFIIVIKCSWLITTGSPAIRLLWNSPLFPAMALSQQFVFVFLYNVPFLSYSVFLMRRMAFMCFLKNSHIINGIPMNIFYFYIRLYQGVFHYPSVTLWWSCVPISLFWIYSILDGVAFPYIGAAPWHSASLSFHCLYKQHIWWTYPLER